MSNYTNGYSFSIWIIIPVLIIMIILTGIYWLCTRHYRRQQPTPAAGINGYDFRTYPLRSLAEIIVPPGLDEEILQSYPKLTYSEANKGGGGQVEEEVEPMCSICLADYEENDTIRVMPHCGHNFHMACVDFWLRQNCTCPICRYSPLAEQARMRAIMVLRS